MKRQDAYFPFEAGRLGLTYSGLRRMWPPEGSQFLQTYGRSERKNKTTVGNSQSIAHSASVFSV